MTPIEQVLKDRAEAMARHDGTPVGVVHVHGAANQLVGELMGARDRLIFSPAPVVDTPPEGAPAEASEDAVAAESELGAEAPAEPADEEPAK